jgi:CMP-N-acetylneuraminic acid synthetase
MSLGKKGNMPLTPITAIVPVRKGSERVPNKNIRPFQGESLLAIKLKALNSCNRLSGILVSSDCDEMLKISKIYGASLEKREPYYASSGCSNSEFHRYIASIAPTESFVVTPVTAPLVRPETIDTCIALFLNSCQTADSLVTTTCLKSYIVDSIGQAVNFSRGNLCRTQDLPEYREINYNICVTKRSTVEEYGNFVGNNAIFFDLNELESIDIDTLLDFEVAEFLYAKYSKKY